LASIVTLSSGAGTCRQVVGYEAAGAVPPTLLQRLIDVGMWAPFLPREWGGLGMNWATFAACHEEFGRACQSVRSILTADGMGARAVWKFGSPGQWERWLRPLANGLLAGFCLTGKESGAVADVSGTVATRTDAGWVINGEKQWTTNGRCADLFLVFARISDGETAFLVPRDTPSVRTVPLDTMSGVRANLLGSVHLDDVHLEDNAVVGPVHGAAAWVRNSCLGVGRVSVAAGAVGLIDACLAECISYTSTRTGPDGRLRDQPQVVEQIADMAIWRNEARLSYRAEACRRDVGEPQSLCYAWMAKQSASHKAVRTVEMGNVLIGARAMLTDSTMDRLARDVRTLPIIEGTPPINRLVVGEAVYQGHSMTKTRRSAKIKVTKRAPHLGGVPRRQGEPMGTVSADTLVARWYPYTAEDCGGLRLYCLAHSGASAALFHDWIGQLDGITVRPLERPGRGSRWAEPPFSDMTSLVAATIGPLLADTDTSPFALLGHSIGALIAYEIAHALRDRGVPGPVHLVVSGHPAPDRIQARVPMGELNEQDVLAHLRRLGGTPQSVLEHPTTMRRLILPSFLADSALRDAYHYKPRAPLDIPLTAISADDDPQASVASMRAWRDQTTRPFNFLRLQGDHFALRNDPDLVLPYLHGVLSPSTPAERRP
jgi:alkylation response protein AidB-like acyl-CoA dehydrogenase/surfactin synthase thioesterase subunit